MVKDQTTTSLLLQSVYDEVIEKKGAQASAGWINRRESEGPSVKEGGHALQRRWASEKEGRKAGRHRQAAS